MVQFKVGKLRKVFVYLIFFQGNSVSHDNLIDVMNVFNVLACNRFSMISPYKRILY